MKLLIVKISSLGDIIHTVAFVNHLRKSVNGLVIDWIVNDAYAELVESIEGVNRVWKFKRGKWGKGWWRPETISEIASMISEIRAEKYDVCLDLQGLFRSGIIARFSGAGKWAGFSNAREGAAHFYDIKIDPGKKPHAVDVLFEALGLFGVEPPQKPDFSFTISENARAKVKASLSDAGIGGKYIVFHMGARWPTKMWPRHYWNELTNLIAEKTGMPIVFTGSKSDISIIEKTVEKTVEKTAMKEKRAYNMAGRFSLPELAALLKNSALMVTVDSGPMHMAAAFSTPIVAIFGPTSPDKTGPRSNGAVEIVRAEMEC
ncbi:MAG: lipopolysaccharide heptosyltransferase I, partial [Nitrospinota bacterium]